jgi:hypothetical protein
MWSQPKRVIERLTNSYRLEELDGTPITGKFSAHRLRGFDTRPGTKLWEEERRWKRLKETGESEGKEERTGSGTVATTMMPSWRTQGGGATRGRWCRTGLCCS